MTDTIFLYLGFGLLADRGFVQTLFGRDLKLTEIPMELEGFELRVLRHRSSPKLFEKEP